MSELISAASSGADIGERMHALCHRLWPINRSLTGDGVRETLRILAEVVPGLTIHEVPTGSHVLDWTIPNEWNVREAWLEGPDGRRVVDFADHNLHLVGYSMPVDATMDLASLQAHLHSLPDQPNAIPYITSYYASNWGFCLSHSQRLSLAPGQYRAFIDATHAPGSLTYGELILPGSTSDEIFLSTYICHPSMANNELSGPVVTAHLARWLNDLPNRRYTYRVIFIPETIGSITYLSRHLDHLRRHVVAGFNITCIGDDRGYSYLPSRAGDSLADRAALHVLKHIDPGFLRYSFLDRGSDERQYCAPGIDLPVATIMRSKYGVYPEYHTSLDDLELVTPAGLAGGYLALQQAIEAMENDCRPQVTVLGEPQLGIRGLYPSLGTKATRAIVGTMMNLIAYSDGNHSLIEIADMIGVPVSSLVPIYRQLREHRVLRDLDAMSDQ